MARTFGMLAIAAAVVVTTTPAIAGAEFTVNTQTVREQRVPSAARLGNGFVVVWTSNIGGGEVYGQRFSAAGAKLGSEFHINSSTNGGQSQADVAVLANGTFVVVWSSSHEDPGVSANIYGQRFTADGVALGGEFRINAVDRGRQAGPSVAALSGGGFVVVWSSDFDNSNGDSKDVLAQRFDANGAAVGNAFRIGRSVETQAGADVAPLPDGGFVVVWGHVVGGISTADSILGQRYNAAGQRNGATFVVHRNSRQGEHARVAVLSDGSFVVVWSWINGEAYNIYAQRYSANGGKIGASFRPQPTSLDQNQPHVAALSGGGFIIVWYQARIDYEGEERDHHIYGHRFAADGSPLRSPFRVNTTTDTRGTRWYPAAVGLANNRFAVFWTGRDGNGNGILGRIFAR
jgi:hypothetical protein